MLSTRRRRQHVLQRIVLLAFLLLAWLALAGTQYWSATSERSVALRNAQTHSLNLATSLAQHAGDTFRIADSMLAGIASRLEGEPDLDLTALHEFLVQEATRSDRVQGLFVYDSRGRWLTSSIAGNPTSYDNSDRAYFKFHRAHPELTPHIGAPVQSRSDGQWIVTVSRRFNRPDGDFGGVVLATVRLSYFERFYESFDTGSQGTIGMTMDDGAIVARLPYDASIRGRSIAGTHIYQTMRAQDRGALTYTSPIDKVSRISAFVPVQGFPLKILAGTSERDAMGSWRDSVTSRAFLTVLAFAMTCALAVWLDLQLRRTHTNELRLSEEASRDALTGLFNRRVLDKRLGRLVRDSASQNRWLTLMLIDVDHFKLYNDTYGHGNGDACLKKIAQALAQHVRDGDIAARYGGEEFVLVLPGCDAHDAQVRARQIVEGVRQLALPHASSNTSDVVTISLGTASCDPESPCDASGLLRQADRALYEAKRRGRNQSALAETD